MTIFLRFPDEATFTGLMPADFQRDGETGDPLPDGIEAISIIGPMYIDPTFDDAGEILTPPVRVPGFHVNALGDLPAAWAQYQIFPASPDRVFG